MWPRLQPYAIEAATLCIEAAALYSRGCNTLACPGAGRREPKQKGWLRPTVEPGEAISHRRGRGGSPAYRLCTYRRCADASAAPTCGVGGAAADGGAAWDVGLSTRMRR